MKDGFSLCPVCGFAYSLAFKPPGSVCQDESEPLDKWFARNPNGMPTQEECLSMSCKGILRFRPNGYRGVIDGPAL